MLKPKTPKKLSFSACSFSLSKVTCQYLLLLVGFDTLTYRKHYDRSPTLVAHEETFLAPLPASVALLVSEDGKETFILCVLFLFCCCCFQCLWTTLLFVCCLWETAALLWWFIPLLLKFSPIKYQLVLSIMSWPIVMQETDIRVNTCYIYHNYVHY